MRRLALCCCAWLSTGCSFLFVRPPPSEHEQLAYFDCESGDAAPAVDVTNAVVSALLTGVALVDDPDTYENERNPSLATGFAIGGVIYTASAVYGFVNTSRCAGAKALLAERVQKTRNERDLLLQAQSRPRAQPDGCRRDLDCKGQRVCANAVCVEPPPAAPPAAAPEPAPRHAGSDDALRRYFFTNLSVMRSLSPMAAYFSRSLSPSRYDGGSVQTPSG
ncbi:MAG TPA: hypothetical protein VFS67_05995 [Polyangiaceae bacterium]|nr:hypothetical protein [Polyangiaceae bacterium]